MHGRVRVVATGERHVEDYVPGMRPRLGRPALPQGVGIESEAVFGAGDWLDRRRLGPVPSTPSA